MSAKITLASVRACLIGLSLAGGTLGAQGVELTGGFVLGNTPWAPAREEAKGGQGWTLGAGFDWPVLDKVWVLVEPRYTRLTERGTTSKASGLAASLGFGRASKGAVVIGLARQQETNDGVGNFERTRTWAKVGLRVPGLMFPLPGAMPVGAHPFGTDKVGTFTRLEFAQALQDTHRGNSWQFNWSLGIRYGWWAD